MAQSKFNLIITGNLNFNETRQSEELGESNESGRLVRVVSTPSGEGAVDFQVQGTYEVDDRLLTFMEKAMELDSRNLELLLPVVEKVAMAYFKR